MTHPRRMSYDEEEKKKRKRAPRRTRAMDVLAERSGETGAPRASLARDPDTVAYRRQERYTRGEYPVAGADETFIERTIRRILGVP